MSRRTRNLLAVVASFAIAVTGVSLLPTTADAASSNLPGGTALDNTITSPANNSSQSGAFTVNGNAKVGNASTNPVASLIYVVDHSGSTNGAAGTCGGNQNGDGFTNSILDCEIAAALALNTQANSTVLDAAVVQFDDTAEVLQTATAPSDPAITTKLKSIQVGGQTNFEAGISTACGIVGSNASKTTIVFLSDGEANLGGNAVTAANNCPSGVLIKTFSIGNGSSCTNANTRGTLAAIAAARGGDCTHVTDLSTLPSIVAAAIAPKVKSVTGTIDGGSPITLMTDPPTPPDQTNVNYSWSVPALTPGTHHLCTTANGTDAGGAGSTTDCIDVVVPDPKRTITIDDVQVNEGSTANFTVSLNSPATSTVTVDYATAPDTASTSDYTSGSGTLTFTSGQQTKTVAVPTTQDTTYEGNETFKVNLTNPVNGVFGDNQGIGTIKDDDSPPTVTIVGTPGNPDSPNTSVKEGDAGCTPVTLTIKLSNPSAFAVTVPYSTGGGTATAGTDYTSASGTVTFAPGETSKTISLCVTGDYVDEPNETFEVALGAPTGAVLPQGGAKSVVTIIDDDRNGSFSCQATGLRLLGLSTFVANGSYSPCMDSSGSLLALQVSALVTVNLKVLGATTDATPDNAVKTDPAVNDEGKGDTSVANVAVALGGHTITADAVKSHAEATCKAPLGGKPTLSASTVLTNVKIDGKPVVLVNGSAYVELNVLGLVGVKVWINRTIVGPTDVTQRAIQVTGLGLLSAVDVVVAEARAGYTGNPCAS